jgi:hypothetical protein
MVALGRRLRAGQDEPPEGQRFYIGGEIVVTMLVNRQIQVAKPHRFGDFDSRREAVNAALKAGQTTKPFRLTGRSPWPK